MRQKILRNKQALIGMALMALVIAAAITAPAIAPNDPNEINALNKFQPGSPAFPLGTDHLGRCVLSRLIFGARYSLGISFPTLLALGVIGLTLGTAAAYAGGVAERMFTIVCDIFMAFPSLVIVMSLTGALGQGVEIILFSAVFSMLVWYAKVIRTYAAIELRKDYIMASKISGCGGPGIVARHIIPNILPQCLVLLCTGIAGMILMVSGFSFLGLGFEPGTPEWGAMLNQAKSNFYSHPELVVYPGLCILITAAGFNLFGEALRDIISPSEASE
jgi:peptide/nickel transport system permease protein